MELNITVYLALAEHDWLTVGVINNIAVSILLIYFTVAEQLGVYLSVEYARRFSFATSTGRYDLGGIKGALSELRLNRCVEARSNDLPL